jgi:hypothetical protein
MAIVSIAITLSFHVKHQPTSFELRMAKPLGAVFWGMSVVMLLLGLGNYIREFLSLFNELECVLVADGYGTGTVNQYSRKVAIVQTGWKTQLSLGVLAMCIVGTCVILLATAASNTSNIAE